MLYVEALVAPDTINTMPEKTLLAFADHGTINGSMPPDGGDAEKVLCRHLLLHLRRPASIMHRLQRNCRKRAAQLSASHGTR